MNITALRPRLIHRLEPVGRAFARAGFTPNQISLLSLLLGIAAMLLYATRHFVTGSLLLFGSAGLDLLDGLVSRIQGSGTPFGAVFDWIVDKYVDVLALLGVGLSGIPIITRFTDLPPLADSVVVMIASRSRRMTLKPGGKPRSMMAHSERLFSRFIRTVTAEVTRSSICNSVRS